MRKSTLKILLSFFCVLCNSKKEALVNNSDQANLPTEFGNTYSKKLNNSLKQLEFISYFEMHVNNNNVHHYSLEFLQELEAIKFQSQRNTIEQIKSH